MVALCEEMVTEEVHLLPSGVRTVLHLIQKQLCLIISHYNTQGCACLSKLL